MHTEQPQRGHVMFDNGWRIIAAWPSQAVTHGRAIQWLFPGQWRDLSLKTFSVLMIMAKAMHTKSPIYNGKVGVSREKDISLMSLNHGFDNDVVSLNGYGSTSKHSIIHLW